MAPLYLQAGGKEILVDMIHDFARIALAQGARVRLEVWGHMTHEFQAHGKELPESREALERIAEAIRWATAPAGAQYAFPSNPRIEVDNFCAAALPGDEHPCGASGERASAL